MNLAGIKAQLALVPEGVTAPESLCFTRLGPEQGVLHTGGDEGIVHASCKIGSLDFCPPVWDQTLELLCAAPAHLVSVINKLETIQQAVLEYLDAPPSGIVDHIALEARLRQLVADPKENDK